MENQVENQNPTNLPVKAEETLSPEVLLEKEKQETLKLQLEVLKLQRSNDPSDKYRKAIEKFNSLSPAEQLKNLHRRKISSAPANEHWNRTIWYMKPVIQKGELIGSKIAVLIYAGQYVAKENIPFLEEMEKKYSELNDVYRKQAEDEHFQKTGKKEKVWFMEKPIQNIQEIKLNEGISIG